MCLLCQLELLLLVTVISSYSKSALSLVVRNTDAVRISCMLHSLIIAQLSFFQQKLAGVKALMNWVGVTLCSEDPWIQPAQHVGGLQPSLTPKEESCWKCTVKPPPSLLPMVVSAI